MRLYALFLYSPALLIGQIVQLDAASAASTSATSGATTRSMLCSGTNVLYVVDVAAGGTVPTPTDSASGTWTALTQRTITGGPPNFRQFYRIAGDGHGSITFTCTGGYCSLVARCFGSVDQSTPLDTEKATVFGCYNCWYSTLTPTVSGELLIAGGSTDSATLNSLSLDSGFTSLIQMPLVGGQRYGIASAIKIKTDTTSEGPTWTSSSAGSGGAANLAAFKPVGGAPSSPAARRRIIQ
jgi:hypothetical protein